MISLLSVSTFAQLPHTGDLMFYLPFDGNANDLSGKNNNATEIGSITYETGQKSQAAVFDGISPNYFTVLEDGDFFAESDPWTLCVWLYTSTDLSTNTDEIVMAQENGSSNAGRVFLMQNKNDVYSGYFANSQRYTKDSLKNHLNKWVHIAVIGNPVDSSIVYYINGAHDTTITCQKKFEACDGKIRIGSHKNTKDFYNGKMDELVFYKKKLEEADITSVMNATKNSGQSIINNATIANLNVVPNPSNGIFNITNLTGIIEIQVFNIAGQQVYSNILLNTNEVNLSNLEKGLYVLRINNRNTIANKRIIIK